MTSPAEFGLACHLGVLSGLPCVGVAKNLLQVQGVSRSEDHQAQVSFHSHPDVTLSRAQTGVTCTSLQHRKELTPWLIFLFITF